MKVKELLSYLQSVDPELEIILQSDADGNGYSPLSEINTDCIYVAENTWSGEVYSTKWSAEEAWMDPEEWQELLTYPKCVVLIPIN